MKGPIQDRKAVEKQIMVDLRHIDCEVDPRPFLAEEKVTKRHMKKADRRSIVQGNLQD